MSKHKVLLYSSTGCPYCKKLRNHFEEWGLEFEERNVTENPDYFNDLHEKGIFSSPAVFIDDKPFIGYRPNAMKKYLGIEDETPQTAEKPDAEPGEIFQDVTPEILNEEYDLVCIGGGPAGTSAAVYAARGKLKTLVIDKAPTSGTLAITHKIANYPGVPEELTGLELLTRMQKQAKDFGATFVNSNVLSVDFSGDVKTLELPEGMVKAKSVFIAVGAKGRSNKIKGEEELTGRGVSYCSTCDAAFFQDKTIAVVGDNEEAVSEAITLSKFAKKVLFLIPGKKLSGEADINEVKPYENIDILWQHRVKEIKGENRLESIVVQTADKQLETWEVDGLFLYLAGNRPGTDFLKDAVERDEDGYVIVDEYLQTSVEGVFAGGDARRTPIKQAVISAADGAIAAMGADKYVNKRKKMIPQYS
ncbi:MAG: FAD-dependent oxidoreductase [Bacillaceae bacterium]|nr:FAD-dependent oxidoreductase [Bacillaceae bacterium]